MKVTLDQVRKLIEDWRPEGSYALPTSAFMSRNPHPQHVASAMEAFDYVEEAVGLIHAQVETGMLDPQIHQSFESAFVSLLEALDHLQEIIG